jgi:CHAT domain-containing protein
LFRGQVRRIYDHSLGCLERDAIGGIRIRLLLDPQHPDLALVTSLPWEFLYDSETHDFLALRRTIAVVRSLAVPQTTPPLTLHPPLRILAVLSNPRGSKQLDLSRERQLIENACARHSPIMVHFLPQATKSALRRALLDTSFHVLHFMGHGRFDPQSGLGTLLFEKDDGDPDPLPGEVLARLLQDASDLRLALLNACDTAVAATESEPESNPFAGVATALVMAAIPAVVAMQFPVSDPAAIAFSGTFYSRLAAGDPLEEALAEARLAVYSAVPDSPEWGTPVLFLRNPDGRLFESMLVQPETEQPLARPATSDQGEIAQGERPDFSALVVEKSRDFVGRGSVLEALVSFTNAHDCGYFIVPSSCIVKTHEYEQALVIWVFAPH